MNIFKYFIVGFKSIITFPFYFTKYFFIGIKTLFLSLPIYIINKFSKTTKKFSKIILALSLCTYLLSIFILTKWYVQNERTKKFSTWVKNQEVITIETTKTNEYLDTIPTIINTPNTEIPQLQDNLNYINVNLNYYTKKNQDTIGWIKINGTKIDYPFVQSKDNDYYLKHDFYKRKSETGWIFADYRNNFEILDNNTILYGHNLINNSMFGDIPDFLKNSWLSKENKPYIKLSTKYHNTVWQIFSIYKTKPIVDYLQTKFNSMENYKNFLNTITNKSAHNFNITTEPTDKIITLSTCDDTGKYRVVVHAKLISIENNKTSN